MDFITGKTGEIPYSKVTKKISILKYPEYK